MIKFTSNKNRNSKKRKAKFAMQNMLPRIPHFGTLLFGILIGIFVSCLALFLFASSDITLKIPALTKAKPTTTAKVATEVAAVQEPRFDFYTELAKNSNEPITDLKSKPKTINGYLVQAGLYRKTSDADAMKAKLALNGYSTKVQPVKQSSGEVWQRVILGSFKSEQNAKVLQQHLKSLDINCTIIAVYAD